MGGYNNFNISTACFCRVSLAFCFIALKIVRLIPQAACTRHGLKIGAKFVWYFKC